MAKLKAHGGAIATIRWTKGDVEHVWAFCRDGHLLTKTNILPDGRFYHRKLQGSFTVHAKLKGAKRNPSILKADPDIIERTLGWAGRVFDKVQAACPDARLTLE